MQQTNKYTIDDKRIAPKVMPPILFYWPTRSEADVCCMAVVCWTFLSMFCYILLLCNRWKQRGSLTTWHLTWKCVWSKGVSLNSSTQKMAPVNIYQCLLNVYGAHTVAVSTVRQWLVWFSSGNSNVKDKPCSEQPCTLWNEEHLDQLI